MPQAVVAKRRAMSKNLRLRHREQRRRTEARLETLCRIREARGTPPRRHQCQTTAPIGCV